MTPLRVFGEGTLKKPTGLVVTSQGHIAVTNSSKHNVVIYNTEGEEVLQFGSKGTADGKLTEPRDIAASRDGRLFVLEGEDNNRRISVFTNAGEFLYTFGKKSYSRKSRLKDPQRIVLDNTRQELYISDDEVKVYDVAGKFIKVFAPGVLQQPGAIALASDQGEVSH